MLAASAPALPLRTGPAPSLPDPCPALLRTTAAPAVLLMISTAPGPLLKTGPINQISALCLLLLRIGPAPCPQSWALQPPLPPGAPEQSPSRQQPACCAALLTCSTQRAPAARLQGAGGRGAVSVWRQGGGQMHAQGSRQGVGQSAACECCKEWVAGCSTCGKRCASRSTQYWPQAGGRRPAAHSQPCWQLPKHAGVVVCAACYPPTVPQHRAEALEALRRVWLCSPLISSCDALSVTAGLSLHFPTNSLTCSLAGSALRRTCVWVDESTSGLLCQCFLGKFLFVRVSGEGRGD